MPGPTGKDAPEDPEAALVRVAQETSDGLCELYRRYVPRVYAYVAYRAEGVQEAEDVVSETFLRVVKNLHRFRYRGEGSFAAWLFRIAHNLVEDQHRARRRRVRHVPLEAGAEIADESLLPGEELARQEQFEELRALVGTLPPRRQKVVLLRFFGGLRNREIAEVLGLDERTVASHLSRGLQDLHQKYLSLQGGLEIGGSHERVASVESRFAN